MQVINVLIVEDDPLIAEAHHTYLGRLEGFSVTAVAHTARDAMRAAAQAAASERPVDLVLLDIGLPDASGISLASGLSGTDAASQAEGDRALAELRVAASESARSSAKGAAPQTTEGIAAAVRDEPDGLTAEEAAKRVGVSRVTAWRYLERLADEGTVTRATEYGKAGRPRSRYRWR